MHSLLKIKNMDKKNIIIGLLVVITIILAYMTTQKKTERVIQHETTIIRQKVKNPYGSNGTNW